MNALAPNMWPRRVGLYLLGILLVDYCGEDVFLIFVGKIIHSLILMLFFMMPVSHNLLLKTTNMSVIS